MQTLDKQHITSAAGGITATTLPIDFPFIGLPLPMIPLPPMPLPPEILEHLLPCNPKAELLPL